MLASVALIAALAATGQAWDTPRIDDIPAALVLAATATQPEVDEPAKDAAPDLLKELVDPGTPEKIASDLQFTEGPVWVPAKGDKPGYLLFSAIPSDTIYRLDPPKSGETGTPVEHRKPSGHSNGLFLDKDGNLLICEHEGRVVRIEKDGSVAVLAAVWEGKSLNSPNDLCVHSSGAIFFTDPPYGLRPPLGKARARELDFHGVYRIDYNGKLNLVTKDISTPNGICLSPDQKTLYVANYGKGEIWAFALKGTQVEGEGKIIAQLKMGSRNDSADGLRADEQGNLYVAGRAGIHVLRPTGESIGLIAMEEGPTNLVFGDDDGKTIYATTGRGSIYRIRVKIPGAVK